MNMVELCQNGQHEIKFVSYMEQKHILLKFTKVLHSVHQYSLDCSSYCKQKNFKL
jgi:hypothetical protein